MRLAPITLTADSGDTNSAPANNAGNGVRSMSVDSGDVNSGHVHNLVQDLGESHSPQDSNESFSPQNIQEKIQNTDEGGALSKQQEGLAEQWKAVRSSMAAEFGTRCDSHWLARLTAEEATEGTITLAAQDNMVRDWVSSRYRERLIELWTSLDRRIRDVRIASRSQSSSGHDAVQSGRLAAEGPNTTKAAGLYSPTSGSPISGSPALGSSTSGTLSENMAKNTSGIMERVMGEIRFDPRLSFETFVSDHTNSLALAAMKAIAHEPDVRYNPLCLVSPVGYGKTHLLQSAAQTIAATSERRVIYLTAERFMSSFIFALRNRSILDFKDMFRSVDVLMIDDVQFIAGKEKTQQEFFHTVNTLQDQGRQIIVSADRPPSGMEGIGERLRSRLGGGLVAEIFPAGEDLRMRILDSKARAKGHSLPEDVARLLVSEVRGSIRELEGAMLRLIAQFEMTSEPLNLESARRQLHDLFQTEGRKVTLQDIRDMVCNRFEITPEMLDSTRRSRSVARPRQIAIYLAKKLTSLSLPDIGRAFGNRDHATVIHSVKRIEALKIEDAALREDLEVLRRRLS